MKRRDNIFAVEGGVDCGKTTVAESLAVAHNFLFIAEYMQMVEDLKAFFEEGPENRLVRLIHLEKTRKSRVADAPPSQLVMMDRSVYLTSFALTTSSSIEICLALASGYPSQTPNNSLLIFSSFS